MKRSLIIAAIALTFCGACSGEDSNEPRFIDASEVPRIQSMANKACLCERGKRDDRDKCWADFNREVEKYHHYTEGTACGPGSVEYVDLGPTFDAATGERNGRLTVFTSYGYDACSAEELPEKKAQYERENQGETC